MELLSISQSRCSSVSHCLTEERVTAHWLLHGNSPWIRLNIVQYTLRPLACFGNNLFTSHIPSHTTAWVLLMEYLLCDLVDEIQVAQGTWSQKKRALSRNLDLFAFQVGALSVLKTRQLYANHLLGMVFLKCADAQNMPENCFGWANAMPGTG